jgi:predicted Na+-dependent transporter
MCLSAARKWIFLKTYPLILTDANEPGRRFTTEYFTGGLAVLMLSMGITLSPRDFVNVLKRPNAVIVGFLFCYALMPALAYGLGIASGLSPALLAGLVLVGCINGGQASNLCTYIANGNVALSVMMTTITTLGAIIMTPLLCKLLLGAVVPVDAVGIAISTVQVCNMYFRDMDPQRTTLTTCFFPSQGGSRTHCRGNGNK